MVISQGGEDPVFYVAHLCLRSTSFGPASDMLRAVRMVIWRDNLISRKAKITPSMENITPEMLSWADDIVRRVLQAA